MKFTFKQQKESTARLIEAARAAQREGGSFREMSASMGAMVGELSMLTAAVDGDRKATIAKMDWCAIGYTLEDMIRRCNTVHAALSHLAGVEECSAKSETAHV